MLRLAVDDRGEAILRVPRDVLPDVQHGAAGGVDQRAAALVEADHLADRHPERREDDNVVGAEAVVAFTGIGEEPDARGAQTIVHVRVVDDLAGEKDLAIRKPASRLVRVIDRAIDAIAEAELVCEVNGQPTDVVAEPGRAHAVDDGAVVLGGQLGRDRILQVEAFAKNERGHRAGRAFLPTQRRLPHARRQRVDGAKLVDARLDEGVFDLAEEPFVVGPGRRARGHDRGTAR